MRFSRPRGTPGRIKSQSQGPQSQITPRDPPAPFPVLIENFGGTPRFPVEPRAWDRGRAGDSDRRGLALGGGGVRPRVTPLSVSLHVPTTRRVSILPAMAGITSMKHHLHKSNAQCARPAGRRPPACRRESASGETRLRAHEK